MFSSFPSFRLNKREQTIKTGSYNSRKVCDYAYMILLSCWIQTVTWRILEIHDISERARLLLN